jgi:hypothetical protein
VFKDYRPPQDAFPIDTLRKAGAIIIGKATLSEYAAGDTYGSMFGITRNPYDLEPLIIGNERLRAANLASRPKGRHGPMIRQRHASARKIKYRSVAPVRPVGAPSTRGRPW